LENTGCIDLYYGDQRHFGITPNMAYGGQTKNNSRLLPATKDKFSSIVGLMSCKNDLSFEKHETTFTSDCFIQFMKRFVYQAVINKIEILDNCPIQKFKKFKFKIEKWEENDVWIYFFTYLFAGIEPDRNFVA
jgi:hypothetical protein